MEQKPVTANLEGGGHYAPPLSEIQAIGLAKRHMNLILFQLLLGQILNCLGWAISLHRGNAVLGG